VGTNLFAVAGHQVLKISTTGFGEIDPNWHATADAIIRSIDASGTNLYLGGNFSVIGGQPRRFLARLSTEDGGKPDPDWVRPIADDYAPVVALLATTQGVYAGGSFLEIGDAVRVGFAFLPDLRAPLVTISGGHLVITRNPADGTDVTAFKIVSLDNVQLFRNDGTTPIQAGEFVTVEEASAGLRYTGTGSVTVASALDASDDGTSSATRLIQVTDTGPPVSIQVGNARLGADGRIIIDVQGDPGATFLIVASPELTGASANWFEVLRAVNATGETTVTVPATPIGTHLFYRAVVLP
jgi:hypothetical protein